MRVSPVFVFLFLTITGCGGNSGNSTPVSPGGEWFGFDSSMNPVTLFISETGEVRSIFSVPEVTEGQTYGAGSVEVSSSNEIGGVLQARGIQPSPGAPFPADLGCNISGSVEERLSLTVNIVCSDSGAIVYDDTFTIAAQDRYKSDSSLNAIAGTYTLFSRPATNMLNITADGTLFGMYHNGANCTVNGTVSTIDVEYSLYWVNWLMTSCTDSFGFFEDTEMSGFAMPLEILNDPQDSYYFLLSGQSARSFFTISTIYVTP
ncbi:MAG: hypothetical protein ACR2Q3_12030 [Woeseiaceae bacterium]